MKELNKYIIINDKTKYAKELNEVIHSDQLKELSFDIKRAKKSIHDALEKYRRYVLDVTHEDIIPFYTFKFHNECFEPQPTEENQFPELAVDETNKIFEFEWSLHLKSKEKILA
jgi:hypothetical protein